MNDDMKTLKLEFSYALIKDLIEMFGVDGAKRELADTCGVVFDKFLEEMETEK